jgi:hypothetical protein
MKAKYRLFRRAKIFYAENATTGKQKAHTADTQESKRLIAAKMKRSITRNSRWPSQCSPEMLAENHAYNETEHHLTPL